MNNNQDPTSRSESDSLSPSELASLATYRESIYGFLAAVFNRVPDADFAGRLTGPDLAAFLSSLEAGELPDEMRLGIQLIASYIQSIQGTPAEEVQTSLVIDRTRLLRGVRPGYGPPPPYESVYSGGESAVVVRVLLAVRRAYSAAEVTLAENAGEQPDYFGIELEFMRLLTQREAVAWGAAPDQAPGIVDMERAFLREHVGAWAARFCDAMYGDAQVDFYRGIALLAKGFVLDETSLVEEIVAV